MNIKKIEEILNKNKYDIVDINLLKPAEYNPRKITEEALEHIKESIRTFGLVEPIVINKDYTIIGGHQRYKAMKQMGFEKVKVSIVDVDKNTEKELNLTLNNEKIQGEWDFKLRQNLLNDLEGLNLGNFELLGLSELKILDLQIDNLSDLEKEFEDSLEKDINMEIIKLLGDKESATILKEFLNEERKSFPEMNDIQLIINKLV